MCTQLGHNGGVGLAVALMYERSIGAKSKCVVAVGGGHVLRSTSRSDSCAPPRWAPYLATLPACEPLPVTWSEEEQRELQGTELVSSIDRDKQLMANDWDTLIQPLMHAHPDLFPAEHFSLEKYTHARTLTSSRGFTIDAFQGHGMVPFADLFNHESEEDVHFTSDGDVCACCGRSQQEGVHESPEDEDDAHEDADAELEKPASGPCPVCKRDVSVVVSGQVESDSIEMVTQNAVPAGREIFNTYGQRNNAALLHMYGFTLPSNPHASCSLDAQLVKQALRDNGVSAATLASRLQLAAQLQLTADTWEDTESFDLAHDDEVVFGRELLMVVNLCLAADPLVKEAKRLIKALHEHGGTVTVPTPELDEVTLEPLTTQIDAPLDVLWQLLANAAVAASYADPITATAGDAGADTGAEDEEGEEEEEEEPEEDDVAFLLQAPGVINVLSRALKLRDAAYPAGSSLEADVKELERMRPHTSSDDTAVQLPAATHALQLRVSERNVLAAARLVLDAHSPSPQPGQQGGTKRKQDDAGQDQRGVKRTDASTDAWHVFD